MNKVPILLLAFNRADHVQQSVSAIREYQPNRIYVECDGPRKLKEGDVDAVKETREIILKMIDWPFY